MKIHKFLLFIEAVDKSKRAQIPGMPSPNGEFRRGYGAVWEVGLQNQTNGSQIQVFVFFKSYFLF